MLLLEIFATLHADNYVYTQQRIETKNVVNKLYYGTSNAKTITLSFWVKSNQTGKVHIGVYGKPQNVTSHCISVNINNSRYYTINAVILGSIKL